MPVPSPAPDELLVAVRACGVCRTDLHVAEGDLPVHRSHVIPGHEVVAEVVALGADAGGEFTVGDRVGVAWLRHTCGECKFCFRRSGEPVPAVALHRLGRRRRICRIRHGSSRFRSSATRGLLRRRTGRRCCARESSAIALCCAPTCQRAGDSGSTASAAAPTSPLRWHWPRGAEVHVMTRGAAARELALALGAASAQGADDPRRRSWTPPFCSRRSASWWCPRSRRSTAAARWPSRASTSVTSRC